MADYKNSANIKANSIGNPNKTLVSTNTPLTEHAPLPPIAMFTIMAMVSPVALNIILPALPSIASSLGLTTNSVQLSFSLYLLALAIGQLLLGPLADRFGRRPVLLGGIIVHMLGCLMAAMAHDLFMLLVGRALQALGGCTGIALARTIMLDRYPRDIAAGKIGYITLAIGLAQAIAPTAGGYLNLAYGWQSLFYFSMILGSTSWVIVLFRLPETGRQQPLHLSRVLHHYMAVIKSPGYATYALSTAIIACGFYLFIGSAPYLVAEHLQGSSADYGNWFLWVSVGLMAGSFIAAKISSKLGINYMVYLGHSLALLGGLLMLWGLSSGYSYWALFLPMTLYTFGRGFSQPNSQSAAISSTNLGPSTASGMIGFLQLLAGAGVAQLAPAIMTYHVLLIPLLITLAPCIGFGLILSNKKLGA